MTKDELAREIVVNLTAKTASGKLHWKITGESISDSQDHWCLKKKGPQFNEAHYTLRYFGTDLCIDGTALANEIINMMRSEAFDKALAESRK